MTKKIAILGGGAAGFFGAIACAEKYPFNQVFLFEKNRQVLTKVRISGGGRCNVTHACFDPALLVKNYPRGNKEMRGPFTRFQPEDTIRWFESRGVALKTEEDGRIFPITDESQTIIDCLLKAASNAGVDLLLEKGVEAISMGEKGSFILHLTSGEEFRCDKLLIASGSAHKIFSLLEKLGHTIVPPVPSLFTFNIPNSPFLDLAGISVPSIIAELREWKLKQEGPLLLTHWGLSGPAILKLSAWAARELHGTHYSSELRVNWVPSFTQDQICTELQKSKQIFGSRRISSESPFSLPKQLWKRLTFLATIPEEVRWSELSQKSMLKLKTQLESTIFNIFGKTTYKQEFVTCGGVSLEEINFQTMESRLCPGLYFAGEVLNIDGVTGGFNFQNAWTTAWIAGNAMG